MPDMLVNLLKLAPLEPVLAELREAGVIVRRAQPHEITTVREFVLANFDVGWADEIKESRQGRLIIAQPFMAGKRIGKLIRKSRRDG